MSHRHSLCPPAAHQRTHLRIQNIILTSTVLLMFKVLKKNGVAYLERVSGEFYWPERFWSHGLSQATLPLNL